MNAGFSYNAGQGAPVSDFDIVEAVRQLIDEGQIPQEPHCRGPLRFPHTAGYGLEVVRAGKDTFFCIFLEDKPHPQQSLFATLTYRRGSFKEAKREKLKDKK